VAGSGGRGHRHAAVSFAQAFASGTRRPVGRRRARWRPRLGALLVAVLVLGLPSMLDTAGAAFKSTDSTPSSGFSASANFYVGALTEWGNDDYGQSAADHLYSLRQIGSATTRSSVSPGYYHTCGIQSDALLWCWGDNNVGQLGLGDTADRFAPVKVGSASWTTVDGGWSFTCGIKTDGTLWCWA
jgi:hypothetical protein